MESNTIRPTMRLGDVLVERGVITEAQLKNSLEYQWTTGARLGEALIQLGYVTADQITAALAWQGSYGLSGLTELIPNPSALGLVNERFARTRQVLPLDFNGTGALVLAMVNPSDVPTIDDVRLVTGFDVVPVVATSGALNEALDLVFSHKTRLDETA
jgi:type IV pilus assembly protein PilB